VVVAAATVVVVVVVQEELASKIKGSNEHCAEECLKIRYKAYTQEHQTLIPYICMQITAIQTALNWPP
jgi:hypothetical protein